MTRRANKDQEMSHFAKLDRECADAAFLAVAEWLTARITDDSGKPKTYVRVVDLTEYDLRAIAGNAGRAWSVKAGEQTQQALDGTRETHWLEDIYLNRSGFKATVQDLVATRMLERARDIERPEPKDSISFKERGTFLAMADVAIGEADKNIRVFYCCKYLRRQTYLGSEARALVDKYDQFGASKFTKEEIDFLENLTEGPPL